MNRVISKLAKSVPPFRQWSLLELVCRDEANDILEAFEQLENLDVEEFLIEWIQHHLISQNNALPPVAPCCYLEDDSDQLRCRFYDKEEDGKKMAREKFREFIHWISSKCPGLKNLKISGSLFGCCLFDLWSLAKSDLGLLNGSLHSLEVADWHDKDGVGLSTSQQLLDWDVFQFGHCLSEIGFSLRKLSLQNIWAQHSCKYESHMLYDSVLGPALKSMKNLQTLDIGGSTRLSGRFLRGLREGSVKLRSFSFGKLNINWTFVADYFKECGENLDEVALDIPESKPKGVAELVESLGSLKNLRKLSLTHTANFGHLVVKRFEDLQNLTDLREFYDTVVADSAGTGLLGSLDLKILISCKKLHVIQSNDLHPKDMAVLESADLQNLRAVRFKECHYHLDFFYENGPVDLTVLGVASRLRHLELSLVLEHSVDFSFLKEFKCLETLTMDVCGFFCSRRDSWGGWWFCKPKARKKCDTCCAFPRRGHRAELGYDLARNLPERIKKLAFHCPHYKSLLVSESPNDDVFNYICEVLDIVGEQIEELGVRTEGKYHMLNSEEYGHLLNAVGNLCPNLEILEVCCKRPWLMGGGIDGEDFTELKIRCPKFRVLYVNPELKAEFIVKGFYDSGLTLKMH